MRRIGDARAERRRICSERLSHCFSARLADRFDAVLDSDETQAVEPLERTAGWGAGKVPETYPPGI